MEKSRIYVMFLMANFTIAILNDWNIFSAIAVILSSVLVLFHTAVLLLDHDKAVKRHG